MAQFIAQSRFGSEEDRIIDFYSSDGAGEGCLEEGDDVVGEAVVGIYEEDSR